MVQEAPSSLYGHIIQCVYPNQRALSSSYVHESNGSKEPVDFALYHQSHGVSSDHYIETISGVGTYHVVRMPCRRVPAYRFLKAYVHNAIARTP